MNKTPTVSIIMPVKNGANYLAEALTAIKAQNVDMEIIVVDDASNDNSALIAESFGCVVLKHDVCKGAVSSKNTALKVARGKYVMFHDHDDVMNENVLATMLEQLESNEEIFAVMAKLQDFFCSELPEEEKRKIGLRLESYFGVFSAAILMRRKVFDIIGLFDESLRAGDIIAWSAKVNQHKLPTKKLDLVSANRRIHRSNFGRTQKATEYKDYATILRSNLKVG